MSNKEDKEWEELEKLPYTEQLAYHILNFLTMLVTVAAVLIIIIVLVSLFVWLRNLTGC